MTLAVIILAACIPLAFGMGIFVGAYWTAPEGSETDAGFEIALLQAKRGAELADELLKR